jgi:hypothetical protein
MEGIQKFYISSNEMLEETKNKNHQLVSQSADNNQREQKAEVLTS